MMTLDAVKAARFSYIKTLYDWSRGDENSGFYACDIGEAVGLAEGDTSRIAQYLKGQGLLKFVSTSAKGLVVSISHRGIVEVEQALSEPERPTEHFPAVVNIVQIGSMANSTLQQGGHGSRQEARVGMGESAPIVALLADIRRSIDDLGLDDEGRAGVLADAETAEAQLRAPKPKSGIVRACLESIRDAIPDALGKVVASGIVARLGEVLAGIALP